MAKGGTRTCSSNTSIEMPAHVGGHSTLTAVGLHTGSITNPCALMNLAPDTYWETHQNRHFPGSAPGSLQNLEQDGSVALGAYVPHLQLQNLYHHGLEVHGLVNNPTGTIRIYNRGSNAKVGTIKNNGGDVDFGPASGLQNLQRLGENWGWNQGFRRFGGL